eukprot:TRINITY_DN59909_c0_g2_i1.p1 TRINITY_DN59909_c0_g2~~TRINITY_DN59909_c0_g2_i1.p1  ORF type:complete len:408 (+),score=54.89 TRINITY_DN59909_c0_g2_i1:47-1270(+)
MFGSGMPGGFYRPPMGAPMPTVGSTTMPTMSAPSMGASMGSMGVSAPTMGAVNSPILVYDQPPPIAVAADNSPIYVPSNDLPPIYTNDVQTPPTDNAELIALRAQVQQLQAQIASLTEENNKLRGSTASVTELQTQITVLKEENTTLVTSHAVEVEQLRETVKVLQEQITHLQEENVSLRSQVNTLQQQNAALMEENRLLREQLEAARTPQREWKDPRGKFPFFGMEVADGIKFKEEHGGKQAYGAVKVVKVWGPSAASGIQALDFIRSINGVSVSNLSDFKVAMGQVRPDSQVPVVVERQHREITCVVNTESCDAVPGSVTRTNIVHARLSLEDSPTRSGSPAKVEVDHAGRSRSRSPEQRPNSAQKPLFLLDGRQSGPGRRPSPQIRTRTHESPRGERTMSYHPH